MSNAACKLCAFWIERKDDPTNGECRRYPPAVVMMTPVSPAFTGQSDDEADLRMAWPDTKAIDWCGEFLNRFVS